MKTIWKYPLMLLPAQKIAMPADAVILSFQVQEGVLTLWAMVDPRQPNRARRFLLFGTGQHVEFDAPCVFIGTIHG